MVEVDFSGNYLNADNCKVSDVGVFIDEGEMKPRTMNGKTWEQLSITVQVAEKEYSHSFRSAEGRRFQDTYGKDTKLWIGKKFSVVFIPWVDKNDNNVIKQNVELIPAEEKKK